MAQYPPDDVRHFRVKKVRWRWRNAGPKRLSRMAVRRAMNPAYMVGVMLWLVGCTMQVVQPTPTATAAPVTPTTSDEWETLQGGLERRVYRPSGGLFTRVTALRIDPAQYDFRVHYQPEAPAFINEWDEALPEAVSIINGNFFDRTDRITGLLFADGVSYGEPYRRRGGTFYLRGGVPGIQSNLVSPYAGEQYDQAVQAFPMLVTGGQQSYFDTRADRATRRTVVAVDSQGRVVILVTTFGGLTLLDTAEFIVNSDLGIVDALNLDGGGSTMLHVDTDSDTSTLASFDPVPAVLAVYPR